MGRTAGALRPSEVRPRGILRLAADVSAPPPTAATCGDGLCTATIALVNLATQRRDEVIAMP
jgi:hypothetical protein